MATVKNFMDLRCWQEARELTKEVYLVSSVGKFASDFGLKDQIRRAAVSIGSNIAEGFERDNNSELLKFLSYAKGSSGEVRSQLATAFDVGYVDESCYTSLSSRLIKISAMISKLQSSIRTSPVKVSITRNWNRTTRNEKPETINPQRKAFHIEAKL